MYDIESLSKLREVVGDKPSDIAISVALETSVDYILRYCNLNELSAELKITAIRMAADIIRSDGICGDTAEPTVSSVKRGDVTISYAADTKDRNGIFARYTSILQNYRKLRW